MKIKSFQGQKINGFLDINFSFFDDINFVTGINGTGKTTVLNFIISILMPRFDYLATQDYEKVVLSIEFEGKISSLSAKRTDDGALIYIDNNEKKGLKIKYFEWDEVSSPSRNREMEQSFYKDQMIKNSENYVILFINSLPTPMYLGLDRRTPNSEENSFRYSRPSYYRSRSRRRNLFSLSLSQGLEEAISFAFEKYREAQRTKEALDTQFRQELVLDLIDFTPSDFPKRLRKPNDTDFKKVDEARRNLSRLPALLGVDEEKIKEKTDPLFTFMEKTKSEYTKVKGENNDITFLKWSFNKSLLDKISSISNKISIYNERVEKLFKQINDFEYSVNSFLCDSGKNIHFDRFGDLVFSVDGQEKERDLRALSSGEIQLIVILAHFHFNSEIKNASVFIIDEPELSLHVEWQERFIETMIAHRDNTQLIMATHAPSIILDRTNKCIDLTPVRPK